MSTGGTFLTHNKILPGSYINFVSKARAIGNLQDRGVVTLAMKNNWGEENKIITISSDEFPKKSVAIFGYDYTSDEVKPIREIFKNAKELKFFRLGKGENAKSLSERLNITAKYSGSRGNEIKIKVMQNMEMSGATIFTYLENLLVDEMFIKNDQTSIENDYILFSGQAPFDNNVSISLSGGLDAEITNNEYSKYLELIEAENFNTIIYDGEDDITKGLVENFVKRLRNDEGVKVVAVMHNYTKADFEGIISVKNDKNLVYWTAGASAGAEINESLTNKIYDGEYIFNAKYSNSELKDAIKNGEFVFYNDISDVKVLKDINTFTTYSVDKNPDFGNNQIVRVVDSTANDIAKIFNDSYIGKVQNNTIGRDIFKSELIDYFRQLQAIGAIDNFVTDNIFIQKGAEKGDVVVDIIIEPVSSMDKLYMKCIIE